MIACVWTGTKYGREYVERVRNMVRRHSDIELIYCLTDRPDKIEGVEMVDISHLDLPGWWSKMALFDLSWRDGERVLYFDLDTIILDSIQPLLDYNGQFAICQNFQQVAGNTKWPCRYGSCVMSICGNFGDRTFKTFMANKDKFINECGKYGDQLAIEKLLPDAVYLQDVMPKDYFLHYRQFTDKKPDSAICIFAGNTKPDNSKYQWVKEAWI